MFSSEINGYKKQEVDQYLSNLKSSHEKALMAEKLKVLEAEKKLLDLKNKSTEIEKREKNILSMLESFKRFQAEGNRNIEVLRGEQLRMIYLRLQKFLEGLDGQYPGILLNSSYKKLVADIETILAQTDEKRNEIVSAGTENDPMRILLSKMQEKRVTQDQPREIKIERKDFRELKSGQDHSPSQIKPVCDIELNENDKYDTLVDKFLNTEPEEEQPKSLKIQSTGFDIKEAINPKDDLSEIMKAFDFYSGDDAS